MSGLHLSPLLPQEKIKAGGMLTAIMRQVDAEGNFGDTISSPEEDMVNLKSPSAHVPLQWKPMYLRKSDASCASRIHSERIKKYLSERINKASMLGDKEY